MKRLAVLLVLVAWPALAQTPPTTTPPALPPAGSPAVPPPPAPAPDSWVPRGNFELAGLDKITARVSPVTGHVGQAVSFGTLTITVRSCLIRGPDQPADQAAYLDITDSRDANLAFHGWMLLSSPGLSMLEHPVYDIRLTACRP